MKFNKIWESKRAKKRKYTKQQYSLAAAKTVLLYSKHRNKLSKDEKIIYDKMMENNPAMLKAILIRKFGDK